MLIIIVSILSISDMAISQNFYNNGANIIINNGAVVYIGGNYINNSDAGTNDGIINSNGEMVVQGDWENNANNTVFPVSGGEVIMNGSRQQTISGTNNTTFENLTLQDSDKILENNNNSVWGTLNLDAALNLNANTFIINNPNANALNYQSKYILSETPPGSYGEIQWNIGNSTGTYSVPFGSGNTDNNDLNLTLTTTSAGSPDNANISFATYPTNANNYPLPTGVTSLGVSASYIADRYWIIAPSYTTNPDIDILFTYAAKDVNSKSNPSLTPAMLRVKLIARHVAIAGALPEYPHLILLIIQFLFRVLMEVILAHTWRLDMPEQEVTIFMPNAFTPGNDGLNDKFGPIGDSLNLVKNYEFLIYNRLGEIIFESNSVNNQWNGLEMNNNQKAPEGVYVWLIDCVNTDGSRITKRGCVTLLRNGK